jgi:hypothetical protein
MRYWLWRAWKWAVLVVVGVSLAVAPSVAQSSATIIILPSSIVPYPTPVFIQISGTWRDSCKPKPPFNVSVSGTTITIISSDTSSPCMAVITSWGPHTIPVGVLPPGTYLVRVFHTANDGTHLLGMQTFVVVAVQPPPPPTPPTPTAVVCDPGAYAEGSSCAMGRGILPQGAQILAPTSAG